MAAKSEPSRDCPHCPRLVEFRHEIRTKYPDWHNAPVPTWVPAAGGDSSVRLLVAGLAPGLKGANRTGRPFTGDYAGDLLYETLLEFGLAKGKYGAEPEDGLALHQTAITNAVRCLPPQNKPVGAEINQCREFLKPTIERFVNLKVIVTLGKIAHDSTIRALGGRLASYPFGHAVSHEVDGLTVISSYHCSRYNTNTGRLTPEMFREVFGEVKRVLGGEV